MDQQEAGDLLKLEPMYRLKFSYTGGVGAAFTSDEQEATFVFTAEGSCEGRITGTMRGQNHPHRRSDGTFEVNFQGVITTGDGASILFDYGGYGRAYPTERRQIISWGRHYSDNERYKWLNDSVAAIEGEVGPEELIVHVYEMVWEPPKP